MLIKEQIPSVRTLDDADDLAEMRLGAVGFIFHGHVPLPDAKRPAARAGTNVLHFARCPKLDRAGEREEKIWFRTIGIATRHLDEAVGNGRWKWCKVCEKEITQKILNEQ